MDYIKEVIPNPNWGMISKQIKKMMEDDKSITYKGIKYTMWYAINHQGMQLDSLGVVPHLYNDAKKYYKWLKDIKKKVGEWERYEKTVTYCGSRTIDDEVIFD